MINRTETPEIKPLTEIHFVLPEILPLSDQANLFWMKKIPDETVRIELHFNAGSIQGKKSIAGLVNSLLFSGTSSKSSKEIYEELDQLGAYLDHEVSLEKAFVSVYCLRSNAKEVIEKVYHAIENANFQEREVDDSIREKKQRLLVSSEKVSFLARQEFQKQLFLSDENYARYTEIDDFEKISHLDLTEFHQEFYLRGLKNIVVVANLETEMIELIKSLFGQWSAKSKIQFIDKVETNKGVFHIEKKEAIQTAIRIGLPLFNKNHPDNIAFQFLQTILGDYFGSRLMSNIREDKGYTYGIGSALVELKNTGYFVIATEVASEVADATLTEIQYEINRLKEELVPDEELQLVKNYLLGQMLKSADGPNAMMDLYMGVHQHGLDFAFYQQYMKEIGAMTSEKILAMAQKYLDWKKFTVILAGKRN